MKKTKNKNLSNEINNRDNYVPIQEIPGLHITYTKPMGQVYLQLSFTFNGYLPKQKFAYNEKLISNILSSGSSSRLWHLLRTKMGAAYYCSSGITQFEDNSLFMIKSAVDENKIVDVIRNILSELRKIKSGKITNDEILRSKRTYCNNNEIAMSNHTEMFDYYTSNIVRGFDTITPHDICLRMNKINKDTLTKASKKLFRSDNMNLFIIGNIKQKQKKIIIDLLDKW